MAKVKHSRPAPRAASVPNHGGEEILPSSVLQPGDEGQLKANDHTNDPWNQPFPTQSVDDKGPAHFKQRGLE